MDPQRPLNGLPKIPGSGIQPSREPRGMAIFGPQFAEPSECSLHIPVSSLIDSDDQTGETTCSLHTQGASSVQGDSASASQTLSPGLPHSADGEASGGILGRTLEELNPDEQIAIEALLMMRHGSGSVREAEEDLYDSTPARIRRNAVSRQVNDLAAAGIPPASSLVRSVSTISASSTISAASTTSITSSETEPLGPVLRASKKRRAVSADEEFDGVPKRTKMAMSQESDPSRTDRVTRNSASRRKGGGAGDAAGK